MRACLLCLILALCGVAPALAAPKLQTFHIDAGDATFTLNEFSRQSTLQLLFDYNTVRGRKTRPVSGDFEAAAALRQMLADTGLIFDYVNPRTLAITTSAPPEGPGSTLAEARSRSSRADSSASRRVAPQSAGTGEIRLDQAPEIDEITILGTHLRGEEPVGEHVVHLGREDINNNPAGTVQDLLRTLPQTFGGGPSEDTRFFSAETQSNSGLGAGINLRGLGAQATLVLINGKRMAPSGTDAAFSDIENIPLSAVERMDILSDGASAVYGSDAVGGVVNFVMRDNFTGAETLVRGGSATRSTLAEYQVAQTLGTRWDSGNAMVSLEFYRRGDLPSYARRYTNSDLTALGGDNFDVTTSTPGNLSIGGLNYAIPRGQNGTQLTASDLVPGTQNLMNYYAGADVLPSQKRWSLYASGRHSLSDSVSLYGNALASRREAEQSNGGSPESFLVPASNAFFPAGITGPIAEQYNFLDDLGPFQTDSVVNNFNVTLGLDIAVGATWEVNLYANYAQEKENQLTTGLVNQLALAGALADSDPATAFNPFADGSHTSPATLDALGMSSRYYVNSKLRTANVTADGPIAHLPGGDLKLAVGVDHRNQVYGSLLAPTVTQTVEAVRASRNVTAAFGELRVPLFGNENGRAGLRRLEISVAGRYENYSDFGSATTPKLGLTLSPLRALTFRSTWGHSIRAPTLADLNQSKNVVFARALPDNSSPQGTTVALLESGNSPHITVERATSWTAGFDVDATHWIPDLSFSATYFNIRFRDRIQEPTNFTLDALNDPGFAYFVKRNPSASALAGACSQGTYIYIGGPTTCMSSGATAIIDVRSRNLASVRTSGIDLSTAYEHRWSPGTLKLRLDSTYLLDFSQQALPGAPTTQLLNTQNNPINIKLRSMLTWQQVRWGASFGINFQNHYRDIASQPNRDVRSFTTFDAQLRYAPPTFGSSWLDNTLLELNAVNILNSSPPFLNNATARLGYDQENADPLGRLLSIQVRKNW